MKINFYLGVTDNNWYNHLRIINPEDINFWQPGGKITFKVLNPGSPFLFKLKSPLNVIGGIGFFSSHTFLPISVAWDTFGERNGCKNFQDFQKMIINYRADKLNSNPTIGCIVLTNPIFFKKEDWIEIPNDWSKNIVQGKSYSTETAIGNDLWQKVDLLLHKYLLYDKPKEENQFIVEDDTPQYGKSILTKVRLGQGAFRVLVTDAYNRKCAITGEKTLPVLEAAHIKPYSEFGPHLISNALLLRSDMHKLFDTGYITITSELKVEVSKRIKEEYQNGKEYYKYHGSSLFTLPTKEDDRPNSRFIEWHNSNIFRE